jgi:hypothetical protein
MKISIDPPDYMKEHYRKEKMNVFHRIDQRLGIESGSMMNNKKMTDRFAVIRNLIHSFQI